MLKDRPLKLALVSCGLGNVHRGFEASTARWFDALSKRSELTVRLYAGGVYPGAQRIANLPRDFLCRYVFLYIPFMDHRQRWEFCYGIEQLTFALGLLPALIFWQPDVVWTKEAPLAHALDFFRFLLHLKFKIVFANGGAFRPATYQQFDYIQHLQDNSYQEGCNWGIPENKMQILCNCVAYEPVNESKSELRQQLGYKDDDFVIVSVAAWNRYHKRIDFLLEEVARFNNPKLHLLLIGHPDTETPALKLRGEELLGARVRWLTLNYKEVLKALKAADWFVLTSINECLGGSLIEAALTPLPIITHPHPGAKFILADDYWMVDLSHPGSLYLTLKKWFESPPAAEKLLQLQQAVRQRFDPEQKVLEFLDMLTKLFDPSQLDGSKLPVNNNIEAYAPLLPR